MSRDQRARFILMVMVLVIGLAGPSLRDRSTPPWSTFRLVQTQANVFTASQQQSPALDTDADGTIFAVWASRRQEGGTFGVFGRLFDRRGVAIGDEVHVNQRVPGHQDAPAVAFGPGHDAWVVWTSTEQAGVRDAIVGRRFGLAEGVFGARGDEFIVNEEAAAHRSQPSVAVSGDRVLAVWTSNAGGRQSITGRIFGNDGTALTGEFVLGDGEESRPWIPVVAAQPGERFVVAWATLAGDGGPGGIRARRVDGHGAVLGEVIEVASGDGDGDGGDHVEPSIDSDSRGRFVIAWMASRGAGGYDVRAQRFGKDGSRRGESILVAGGGEAWRSGVSVAAAADGRFVVAYNAEDAPDLGDTHASVAPSNVLAQRFDATGQPMGPRFRVNAADPGRQGLTIGSSARRLVWGDGDRIAAAWSGGTGADASGVGLSVHGPPGVPAVGPSLRIDEAIRSGNWPLGQTRTTAAAPVRNESWVPEPPDASVVAAGGDLGFVGFQSRGWDPADADIAVGPNQIVVVVNQAIRFYDKDGTLTLDQDISGPGGFWEAEGAGGFVFDPVVLFDRFSQRFIVAATERLGNNTSLMCVAVSDDSDPNGDWNRYRYDLSGLGGNIDFPNLGVGPDAIYLTTDFFDPPRGNWTHIFPKQPMLDGDDAPVQSVRNHTDVRGHGAVKTYDAGAPAQYFATPYVSNSFIQLVAITDPLGDPARVTFNLTVPGFTNPPDADQRGTTNRADTVDRRFKHGVYRNGSLWLAHAIGEAGTARVRWYEIRMNGWPAGGTPTLRQTGTLDLGPGVHTFFPAIDVDDAGNMALAFNQSSTQQYISVERTFRLAGDPPGTLRRPTRLRMSLSPELGNRWGDYSGLEEDPVAASVFWSHVMYRTTDWRTWVGRFDILEAECPADVDGSGDVGFADLLAVLAAWGPCGPCAEDIDGDGDVGFADLLAVLAAWGPCPEA